MEANRERLNVFQMTMRTVLFQLILITGAAPISKALHRPLISALAWKFQQSSIRKLFFLQAGRISCNPIWSFSSCKLIGFWLSRELFKASLFFLQCRIRKYSASSSLQILQAPLQIGSSISSWSQVSWTWHPFNAQTNPPGPPSKQSSQSTQHCVWTWARIVACPSSQSRTFWFLLFATERHSNSRPSETNTENSNWNPFPHWAVQLEAALYLGPLNLFHPHSKKSH